MPLSDNKQRRGFHFVWCGRTDKRVGLRAVENVFNCPEVLYIMILNLRTLLTLGLHLQLKPDSYQFDRCCTVKVSLDWELMSEAPSVYDHGIGEFCVPSARLNWPRHGSADRFDSRPARRSSLPSECMFSESLEGVKLSVSRQSDVKPKFPIGDQMIVHFLSWDWFEWKLVVWDGSSSRLGKTKE